MYVPSYRAANVFFLLYPAPRNNGWRDTPGKSVLLPATIAFADTGWPLERRPYLFETSIPGVFAVGEIRSGSVKRVASAVGEDSVVVHLVHRALAADQ